MLSLSILSSRWYLQSTARRYRRDRPAVLRHRDNSAWKGMSAQGAGEAPMRGAGMTVAGGSITATVGGRFRSCRYRRGRRYGCTWQSRRCRVTEWQGGAREGSFSDEANPRSGGHGVTSPSSCFLGRFACVQTFINWRREPTACGSSLLSTSPSYRQCNAVRVTRRHTKKK